MEVRRARKEDSKRVAELAVKLARQHEAYDARRFALLYTEADAKWYYGSRNETADEAVLVAEIDDQVVGYIYIQYEAVNYPGLFKNAAYFHDIYVDESARGSGAGQSLMNAAIETARGFGADILVLSVAAKNEHARAFFERNGLRTTMFEMTLNL
jgi:ribosomal protein S18 acetylase RimI-like enzyme